MFSSCGEPTGPNCSGVPRAAGSIRNCGIIGLMERSCAWTGTPAASLRRGKHGSGPTFAPGTKPWRTGTRNVVEDWMSVKLFSHFFPEYPGCWLSLLTGPRARRPRAFLGSVNLVGKPHFLWRRAPLRLRVDTFPTGTNPVGPGLAANAKFRQVGRPAIKTIALQSEKWNKGPI